MASSNFVDYVKLFLRSGKGGNGSMHLHREKFVAKGGPDGGNGGRGGHIILRGNKQYWTLIHLKYRKHTYAEDGQSGSGSLSTGANGKDVILDVPLGTVVKNPETYDVLLEVTEEKDYIIDNPCRQSHGYVPRHHIFEARFNMSIADALPSGAPAATQIAQALKYGLAAAYKRG